MVTDEQTFEKVQEILQTELNLSAVPHQTAKQEDIDEWDSLAFMAIVSRIEDEFEIEASPQNIHLFSSIPDIVNVIKSYRKP